MNKWMLIFGAAALQLASLAATAQTPPTAEDKAAARTQRRAAGAEAAREFQPGEGNPIPDARPKVSRAERKAARVARKPAGAEAAREFKPGEGNPEPEARARIPRAERQAANAARRAEIRRANKAGQIPSYGENYGGKTR
ncbi:hypothetical protein [Variovorax sp. JS1663]|uniref:hypothetical protein n=1 Tax=Variovorax sp. JS1663 TaxID=1851577 RepID=UPI001302AD75|nr:hypothetical protein [Variovorax sp. JS1663]